MTATDQSPVAPRTSSVRRIAEEHADERGPLLVILHAVMDEHGHITREDIVTIADVLNVSIADVHGVVTFYKDFRTQPPAQHTLALCRAEACQSVGADETYAAARQRYLDRADIEVEEIFCFGNCALGPSGQVDGRLHGRLTPQRLAELTAGWDA